MELMLGSLYVLAHFVLLFAAIAFMVLLAVAQARRLRWELRHGDVRNRWFARAARRWGIAVLLLAASAPAFAQAPAPAPPATVHAQLFAGWLATVDQNGEGRLQRGADLYALRLVVVADGPAGLRVGFRGDLTALGVIDPSSLDFSRVRTAEGYATVTWPRVFGPVTVGPAVMAGTLIPTQETGARRHLDAFGGGARVGWGSSWLYLLAGRDKAADDACSCSKGRAVVVGTLERWRMSLQGEWISGPSGRKRLGAMVRIPLPH